VIDPTIENSYRKQVTVDGRAITLDIMDTAGQEEYAAMRDQYLRQGEGFVLVYSIDTKSSYERISEFYQQILRVKEEDSCPCILVGNKCDLEENRDVSKEEGEALAKDELSCPFFEASAKTCINVQETYYELVRVIDKYRAKAAEEAENAPAGGKTKTSGGKRKRGCTIL